MPTHGRYAQTHTHTHLAHALHVASHKDVRLTDPTACVNSSCATGFQGVVCAVCTPGYGMWNNQCKRAPLPSLLDLTLVHQIARIGRKLSHFGCYLDCCTLLSLFCCSYLVAGGMQPCPRSRRWCRCIRCASCRTHTQYLADLDRDNRQILISVPSYPLPGSIARPFTSLLDGAQLVLFDLVPVLSVDCLVGRHVPVPLMTVRRLCLCCALRCFCMLVSGW